MQMKNLWRDIKQQIVSPRMKNKTLVFLKKTEMFKLDIVLQQTTIENCKYLDV